MNCFMNTVPKSDEHLKHDSADVNLRVLQRIALQPWSFSVTVSAELGGDDVAALVVASNIAKLLDGILNRLFFLLPEHPQ